MLYTRIHTDGRSKSVLNHFLLSPRLLPLVVGCGIVERGDNRSRHCPIWLKLQLGILPPSKTSSKWVPRRPAWTKASLDEKFAYKQNLHTRLLDIEARAVVGGEASVAECLKCEDPHCKVSHHSETRDSYMLDILSAIIESSHVSLPTYGGCWVGDKRPGVCIP